MALPKKCCRYCILLNCIIVDSDDDIFGRSSIQCSGNDTNPFFGVHFCSDSSIRVSTHIHGS